MRLGAACTAFQGDPVRIFGDAVNTELGIKIFRGVVRLGTLSVGCRGALWVVLWNVAVEG